MYEFTTAMPKNCYKLQMIRYIAKKNIYNNIYNVIFKPHAWQPKYFK